MGAYFAFDLQKADVDLALVARLPRGLATYYLALPLAREDGAITVALTHPENDTALAVLRDVLGEPLVPVRAAEADLRRQLDHVYGAMPPSALRVLCWSADPLQASAVRGVAERFAGADPGCLNCFTSAELDLDTIITVAAKGEYSLAVLQPPEGVVLTSIVERSSLPLLLLGPSPFRYSNTLIALRGYASDTLILDWLKPLLSDCAVHVTLLPLQPVAGQPADVRAMLDAERKKHMHECVMHPALSRAHTTLQLRQGDALSQLINEVQERRYDLIALTAEGYGAFVLEALEALERWRQAMQMSLFILRPPACGTIQKTGR